jgi:hypothetical protein
VNWVLLPLRILNATVNSQDPKCLTSPFDPLIRVGCADALVAIGSTIVIILGREAIEGPSSSAGMVSRVPRAKGLRSSLAHCPMSSAVSKTTFPLLLQ